MTITLKGSLQRNKKESDAMNDKKKQFENKKILALGLTVLIHLLTICEICILTLHLSNKVSLGILPLVIIILIVSLRKVVSALCSCKDCGTKISVRELLKKTNIKCPHCGKDILI